MRLSAEMDEFKGFLAVGDDFDFDVFVQAGNRHAQDARVGRIVIDQQNFCFGRRGAPIFVTYHEAEHGATVQTPR